MEAVGRNLRGSSSPTPPDEAGSPKADCTGSHPGFWSSPEQKTPQPVPVLCHPQGKEVFPYVHVGLPVF